MAETGLSAAVGLGAAAPYVREWSGFSIAESPHIAMASIAARNGGDQALRAAATAAFDITLPEPGCWTQADSTVFTWLGPGQWTVEGEGDGPSLNDRLERAFGDLASIVDQSDAWVRLHIAGPRARSVLEKLCPLDLHPSVFPVGSATRTLMDHLSVSIAFLDDRPQFTLWVERSAGRSFLHALVQAADSSCGPD